MAFQNTTTVCASLSNFINLLWQLKTSITKSKPQKITYRSYKNFDSARFNEEFKYVLSKENIISCTKFYQIFLQKLNKHAPLKCELPHANHIYISKYLRKAILLRKSIVQKMHRPLLKKNKQQQQQKKLL